MEEPEGKGMSQSERSREETWKREGNANTGGGGSHRKRKITEMLGEQEGQENKTGKTNRREGKGREGKEREGLPQKYKRSRDYLNKLYVNTLDSLEEMGKFLETYDLPSLNHEEKKNLN